MAALFYFMQKNKIFEIYLYIFVMKFNIFYLMCQYNFITGIYCVNIPILLTHDLLFAENVCFLKYYELKSYVEKKVLFLNQFNKMFLQIIVIWRTIKSTVKILVDGHKTGSFCEQKLYEQNRLRQDGFRFQLDALFSILLSLMI
ncbi:hypothetical protein BpHYR1_037797 [Brachionus plicatilis]|uniref:Transmembrane protein n=1 Tax=Brachionus plicatilis TaxID=10195 RepID=A0A3M7PB75_BRAPC|nr:hypothetical protein BpHYR1_037797 [Brachionus plicatilis]